VGPENTDEEIDCALSVLRDVIGRLGMNPSASLTGSAPAVSAS